MQILITVAGYEEKATDNGCLDSWFYTRAAAVARHVYLRKTVRTRFGPYGMFILKPYRLVLAD